MTIRRNSEKTPSVPNKDSNVEPVAFGFLVRILYYCSKGNLWELGHYKPWSQFFILTRRKVIFWTDAFAVFASSKKIFSSLIVCLRTPQLFLLRIGRCYLSVTRGPPAKEGPYCLTGQTKMTSSPLHLLAGCSFFPRSSTPRYWIHPEWRQSSRSCSRLVSVQLVNLHRSQPPNTCDGSIKERFKVISFELWLTRWFFRLHLMC